MRSFRFLPQARTELLDEISYYGSAKEGLGVRFERAVAEVVRKAVANPEQATELTSMHWSMFVTSSRFPAAVLVSTVLPPHIPA